MRNAATVNPWTTWSSKKKRARKPLQKVCARKPSSKKGLVRPWTFFVFLFNEDAMCSTKSSIQMLTANDDSPQKKGNKINYRVLK